MAVRCGAVRCGRESTRVTWLIGVGVGQVLGGKGAGGGVGWGGEGEGREEGGGGTGVGHCGGSWATLHKSLEAWHCFAQK